MARLGDGLLVPPSYYYYVGPVVGWIPTDFFYTSPDYDFVPNFRVGRLPVDSADEAAHVVDKIIRWHKNARWEWFKNVSLASAGRLADNDPVRLFDLGCEEAVRRDFFDKMNVTRCYEPADRFERSCFEPVFTTASAGIFLYAGHASTCGLGDINANEVMRYAANDRVPVVFADACSIGAFDMDLSSEGRILAAAKFPASFGEALLKSPAGAIAVFCGSRLTLNETLFYYNEGRPVVAKLGGLGELLHYALESYHMGSDTLGKLSSDALHTYVAHNRLADSGPNRQTVFTYVLLGDPALSIPVRSAP